MSNPVLTLNAGSSSIKFGVFDIAEVEPVYQFAGEVTDIAGKPHFAIKNRHGKPVLDRDLGSARQPEDLPDDILGWVHDNAASDGLAAIGHRIVHGGSNFTAPTRLDAGVIDELARLTPMAPLHQQACLGPARRLLSLLPNVAQVGCFDTGFHAG